MLRLRVGFQVQRSETMEPYCVVRTDRNVCKPIWGRIALPLAEVRVEIDAVISLPFQPKLKPPHEA